MLLLLLLLLMMLLMLLLLLLLLMMLLLSLLLFRMAMVSNIAFACRSILRKNLSHEFKVCINRVII